jgi:hypothetical protein
MPARERTPENRTADFIPARTHCDPGDKEWGRAIHRCLKEKIDATYTLPSTSFWIAHVVLSGRHCDFSVPAELLVEEAADSTLPRRGAGSTTRNRHLDRGENRASGGVVYSAIAIQRRP